MEKPADTESAIHELIARRWSPRAFEPRPLSPDQVTTLLEAARWAPSCFNEQPWSFLIAPRGHQEQFEQLLDCLVAFNRGWARNASLLILAVARLRFDRNGKPNRHAQHDVGAALAQLGLQATAMGLAAHSMAGFDLEKARAAFAIPDDCEPLTMVVVGWPGDPADLPAELQERELEPRQRRPLAQFVFAGTHGQAADLPGGTS